MLQETENNIRRLDKAETHMNSEECDCLAKTLT